MKKSGARAPSWSSSERESVAAFTAKAASSRMKPGGLSGASARWNAATATTTAASAAATLVSTRRGTGATLTGGRNRVF